MSKTLNTASREEKVRLVLDYHRVTDLQLSYDEVMAQLALYDNTVDNLFCSEDAVG